MWGLDVAQRYGADAVRYYLMVNMPETKDSDWAQPEFVQRDNDELVVTWGNLVNRVLSFAHKQFGGCVPAPFFRKLDDSVAAEEITRLG